MPRKLTVLALFDAVRPTTLDQDLTPELKTADWKTEAAVLKAFGELGYTHEHLALFDDLDLLRQKLQAFSPDVIFNLADQFRNNRALDQHIALGDRAPLDGLEGCRLHKDPSLGNRHPFRGGLGADIDHPRPTRLVKMRQFGHLSWRISRFAPTVGEL